MGQFKPMVKMFTDEPSVILKLKKGGKVAAKGQAEGFKSMSHASGNPFDSAESGKAPKKPSMQERRKAMNPNQYAKGGKVAHKQLGGAMPVVQNPAGSNAVGVAPMQAMGRAALSGMAPSARMARAAAVRRALTGMKKGGSADCSALEKELKHHESMSASKAHGKASGGEIDSAETKTTLKNSVKPFAKTKMDTSKKDKAHGTGEVKEGKPAGYKMGGTIEGNEKAFENTKMVTSKVDRAHGTGGVKMANAGGFAKGGKVPGLGNAIEGGNWENRPADTAKPGVTNTTTGGVKEANAGGYKKGGAAKKAYATGGEVDMGQAERTLRQTSRGDEGRSYNVVDKSGKVISTHKSQSDAMRQATKDLDNRSVKRKYASGGNVVDDGKAEKMPRHFVSRPVANSLQSGTFKKGGKVKKFADGDLVDASKGAYDKASQPDEDDMKIAETIRSVPRKLYEGAKSLFGVGSTPKPAGSVTKTEKSVTVAPAKKRGGSAK